MSEGDPHLMPSSCVALLTADSCSAKLATYCKLDVESCMASSTLLLPGWVLASSATKLCCSVYASLLDETVLAMSKLLADCDSALPGTDLLCFACFGFVTFSDKLRCSEKEVVVRGSHLRGEAS